MSVEINKRARSQYISDLTQFGADTQAAILRSNTGLANINKYLTQTFEEPIPTSIKEGYQDYIRSAQAARGFGGGGAGETGEEARFLFTAAEARRQQVLPLYQSFSQGLLGMSGLGGPQMVDQNTIFQQKLASNELDFRAGQAHIANNLAIANTAIGAVGSVAGLGLGIGALSGAFGSGGGVNYGQMGLSGGQAPIGPTGGYGGYASVFANNPGQMLGAQRQADQFNSYYRGSSYNRSASY